ncbi:MAG TPA: phage virion morphogenesis protein [Candidatus Binataceae bacterium]|nr:phage virion morphogenesis protein [Candidatus Binataceae bacterium]
MGAGLNLEIKLDDAKVVEQLGKIATRTLTLKPVLESIGKSFVASTRRRFEQQRGPDGQPWKPLRPATIAKRDKRAFRGRAGKLSFGLNYLASGGAYGTKALIDRARLLGSITYKATSTELAVGTNRKFPGGEFSAAAIHQLGGTSGMAPGPAAIPARPFLGADRNDMERAGEIIVAHYSNL